MTWTTRAWFRNLCRLLVCALLYQSIEPAAARLPWRISWTFGPSAAYAASADSPALGIGRTLSAATTDGQVTVTYTVFSRAVGTIDGILLATTLQAGVQLVSATPLPDRNGQELSWSLGPLGGFGTATAQVTIQLPTSVPAQLDAGAAAFGTLDGVAVNARTIPAALRTGAVAPELLASTPEADTSDPFIVAKAAELGFDRDRVFAFVRDEIGFEAYRGSLRGARGTLWSGAGNSLDKASLLVALLRTSAIPAQYVHGTASNAQARQLVLSMFSPGAGTVGIIPAGADVADPGSDPELLAFARDHYWVEASDDGVSFTPLDPTLGSGTPAAADRFTTVPDPLRHTVVVRLRVESTSTGSSAFGLGPDEITPLSQTFTTAELVGKPITIGHFTNSGGGSAGAFSLITNTYSPYLRVGDVAGDPGRDPLIHGDDYQDQLTNFAFSSRIVTGVFLDVDVVAPGGATRTFERTLADRVGIAARHGAGGGSIAIDPSGPPLITPGDLTTVSILGSRYDLGALQSWEGRLKVLIARVAALQTELGGTIPALDDPRVGDSVALGTEVLIAGQRSGIALYEARDDTSGDQLGRMLRVRSYLDSPRITIAASRVEVAPDHTQSLRQGLDLRKADVRTVVFPGQATGTEVSFRLLRGSAQSALESVSFGEQVATLEFGKAAISTSSILEEADDQGIARVTLTPADFAQVDRLGLPPDASALIADALGRGKVVIAPTRPVPIGGEVRVGWFEIDIDTGETVGVLDDGSHGTTESVATRLWSAALTAGTDPIRQFMAGFVIGLGANTLPVAVLGPVFAQIYPVLALKCLYKLIRSLIDKDLRQVLASLAQGGKKSIVLGYFAGKYASTKVLTDPPLGDFQVDPGAIVPVSNSATLDMPATASAGAGAVVASLDAPSIRIDGHLDATWSPAGTSSFRVTGLTAGGATVADGAGHAVGTGAAVLSASAGVPVAFTAGSVHVVGSGALAFYAAATTGLGVSGDWGSFAATATGSVVADVTTDALRLDGTLLPAGTYRVTAPTAEAQGNGPSTSPTFSGAATIDATGAVVQLPPSTGTLALEGTALDTAAGVTLGGYAGRTTVTAGADTDHVDVTGSAATRLSVAGTPATLPVTQGTPAVFAVAVQTSLADTYHVSVDAPPGWTVTLDAGGQATLTPPAGLQSGSFPIRVAAESSTQAGLGAQGIVTATVGATAPGVSLQVVPDPDDTLPFNGAPLPTFQAIVHNLGPAADTFALTFPQIPGGFAMAASQSQVTLPGGGSARLGVYVRPTGALPAPGTPASFEARVTSTTAPAIADSQAVSFVIPELHAVVLAIDPPLVSGPPGTMQHTTLTLTDVGNVPESVALSVSAPPELAVGDTGAPIALGIGGSASRALTLTPDAATPLNTRFDAGVAAVFGPLATPSTATAVVTVLVAIPGVADAQDAASAAGRLGLPGLAGSLGGVAAGLAGLCNPDGNPADQVATGQLLAHLDSLIAQLDDPLLARFIPDLSGVRSDIAAGVAGTCTTVLNRLASVLGSIGDVLGALAVHNFTLTLAPSTATAQPNTPATFQVNVRNTTTATNTYDLSLSALPAGVAGAVSAPTITLAPGEATNVDQGQQLSVTITPSSAQLMPFAFGVTATAHDAPAVARTAQGSFTARDEFVQVVSVDPTPTFVDPGAAVVVSARVLNAVNTTRSAKISYVLTDAAGATVRTSQAQPLALTVLTSLETVDLGPLDTTGLALGSYTIVATVTDPGGTPIPGGIGQGTLLVGSPVKATLALAPTTLPPGTGRVTTTLDVENNVTLPPPQLALLGLTDTAATAKSMAIRDKLIYVCGTANVSIVDVHDPTAPSIVKTFADGTIVAGNNSSLCRFLGADKLVVMWQVGLNAASLPILVYDISDPLNPSLLTSTSLNRRFISSFYFQGSTAFATTEGVGIFAGLFIQDQFGEFQAFDFTDPTHPVVAGSLLNTRPEPAGGDFNMWQAVPFDDRTALVGTTSSEFGNLDVGVGQILTVDVSDPTHLTTRHTLDVPNTRHIIGLAIQGTVGLALAKDHGWQDNSFGADPFPNLNRGAFTATRLDLADPDNPVLKDTVTLATNFLGGGNAASLGNGFFALSSADATDKPLLTLVDVNDPDQMTLTSMAVPAGLTEIQVVGNQLYTTSDAGLAVYDIGSVVGSRVTPRVRVPKGTGVTIVPGSFTATPNRIVSGPDFDTIEWERSLLATRSHLVFGWQSEVTNLQPGEARAVALGATVDFLAGGVPGTLELAPLKVAAEQILALDPAAATVQPGGVAPFMLTVRNPTAAPVTYLLEVDGVPPGWVDLAPSVVVAAQGSVDVPLTLRPESLGPTGNDGFVVTAVADTGAAGSVHGTLAVVGTPIIASDAHGVILGVAPGQATAGQGTTVSLVARIINTGNVADSFALSTNLPAGIAASFGQNPVEVPAGIGSFREVALRLTPARGTPPGDVPFTVSVASTTAASATDARVATLTVAGSGVGVALDPPSGPPGSTFQVTVTNTGQVVDTFDLAPAGPAGVAATLDRTAVTLDPGASTVVALTVGPIAFAVTGSLDLMVVAASHTTPAVRASATATVTIAGTKGVTAVFDPPSLVLGPPGPATLQLTVDNVGNTEDGYAATITGTSGPLTAALRGLDGQPAQTISEFRLPGLAVGGLRLDVTVAAIGQGSVTVLVTSLTDPSIHASATAVIGASGSTTTTTVTTTTTTTTLPSCGNGVLDAGEQCDPNTPTPACDVSLVCAPAGAPDQCTCVPKTVEVCGDCIDNDNNGLTDFEDPACCATANVVTLTLKRGRIKPVGTASRLKLQTLLAQAATLDPTKQDVYVQLRKEGGDEIICAKVPATSILKKGKAYKFIDRLHQVLAAKGIDHLQLRTNKQGIGKLKASGKSVQFATPSQSSIRVTLGFKNPTASDATNRCARLTQPQPFRASKKGALRFP